jgi:hypothetical protein
MVFRLRLIYGLILLFGTVCFIFGTLDFLKYQDSWLLISSWILSTFLIGYAITKQRKENKGSKILGYEPSKRK